MDSLSIETELAIIQNKFLCWVDPGVNMEPVITRIPLNELFKIVRKDKRLLPNGKKPSTFSKLEDVYIVNWSWYEKLD